MGQLHETAALLRHQAAAVTGRDAGFAQPLRMRLEVADQLRVADALGFALAIDEQCRLGGSFGGDPADQVDDGHALAPIAACF